MAVRPHLHTDGLTLLPRHAQRVGVPPQLRVVPRAPPLLVNHAVGVGDLPVNVHSAALAGAGVSDDAAVVAEVSVIVLVLAIPPEDVGELNTHRAAQAGRQSVDLGVIRPHIPQAHPTIVHPGRVRSRRRCAPRHLSGRWNDRGVPGVVRLQEPLPYHHIPVEAQLALLAEASQGHSEGVAEGGQAQPALVRRGAGLGAEGAHDAGGVVAVGSLQVHACGEEGVVDQLPVLGC
mmetsp:Transcript_56413/g.128241  ORF Transcript_56413/g.128241 Transcript_56413/m.128241 type:complete len:233 (-) Transcript_56413:773-1471(-)